MSMGLTEYCPAVADAVLLGGGCIGIEIPFFMKRYMHPGNIYSVTLLPDPDWVPGLGMSS